MLCLFFRTLLPAAGDWDDMERRGRARQLFGLLALILVFAVSHAKKSKRWTYPRCVTRHSAYQTANNVFGIYTQQETTGAVTTYQVPGTCEDYCGDRCTLLQVTGDER